MQRLVFLLGSMAWLMLGTACGGGQASGDQKSRAQTALPAHVSPERLDTATFAGGCFWCVEAGFEQIRGVAEAVSGYAGGSASHPSYRQVSAGHTDHAESVQVYYNPERIGYRVLLDIFFTVHDPTQLNRQGPDVGKQYRSAIFYHNRRQERLARRFIDSLGASGRYQKPIVTELNPLHRFWKAEEYHQDYERKNPNDRYIQQVSRPKIERVRRKFEDRLKKSEG
jgi:peptide-methionine (S)-S-oxide reductase